MRQTQAKSNKILEELSFLSPNDPALDLHLHRLNREAKKLAQRPNSTAQDYAALGAVECMMGRFQESMSAFRNALARSPYQYSVRFNYALALERFGHQEKAITEAKQAWEILPGDLKTARLLFRVYLTLGRFADALYWVEQQVKETPNQEEQQSKLKAESGRLTQVLEFLDSQNVPAAEIETLISAALKLLQEHQIYAFLADAYKQEDEDDEWITQEYLLPKPIDEVIELKVQFADLLARHDLDKAIQGRVLVSFSPSM